MRHLVSRLESYAEGNNDVQREINRAIRLGKRGERLSLAFTVTFSNPPSPGDTTTVGLGREVQLFRDHGIRPALFQDAETRLGGLQPALRFYVERRTGVTGWGDIARIEMHLFPTPQV